MGCPHGLEAASFSRSTDGPEGILLESAVTIAVLFWVWRGFLAALSIKQV